MIKIIGFRRIMLILILIGFNALLAAAMYLYIQPPAKALKASCGP